MVCLLYFTGRIKLIIRGIDHIGGKMENRKSFFTAFLILLVFISILLSGCSTSNLTTNPEAGADILTPPAAASTSTTAAAASPASPKGESTAPAPTAANTAAVDVTGEVKSISSVPEIVNTFPVQTLYPGNKGGGSGSAMLVLPGQVWTATMFGGLQLWDARTGKVVKTFSKVPSKVFYDIEYDGKNLWVLANDNLADSSPDSLYVLSLPNGEIVKKVDLEAENGVENIGMSPGKIWIGSTIYDTDTLQPNPVSGGGLPGESHFAYDGEQWMWITGVYCHGCGHDLWLFDVNNLPDRKDAQNSGTLNDGVLGSQPVLAGGRMWLVVRPNGDPVYMLDAYDIQKTDRPAIQIDLTSKFQETDSQSSDVYLTADGTVLWLSLDGMLYYFDLVTGEELGSLAIGTHVMGIGFDGNSLWVLSNDDGLIQISIPWKK
jgi:hypothetical protein